MSNEGHDGGYDGPQFAKLYGLKAGDLDPELNKVIKEIVLSSEIFIVYLADDLSIQWRTDGTHQMIAHAGEVLGRVAILEAQSSFIEDQGILKSIRYQVAEGLARCLDGQPLKDSLLLLDEAGNQLSARNKEIAWKWYFTAAYWVTGGCAVVFAVFWCVRASASQAFGLTAFQVLLGGLCGAFGAMLSMTTRADRLVLDANAGKRIHQLEGLSRIGAGIIGALFVALAVKSGLVMGGVQFAGSKLALLLAVSIVGGASERLVPSLVLAFEKSVLNSVPDKPANPAAKPAPKPPAKPRGGRAKQNTPGA